MTSHKLLPLWGENIQGIFTPAWSFTAQANHLSSLFSVVAISHCVDNCETSCLFPFTFQWMGINISEAPITAASDLCQAVSAARTRAEKEQKLNFLLSPLPSPL